MIRPSLLFLLFFIFPGSFHTQEITTIPFPFGVIDQLHSTVLSENRILNIYLPKGYHSDSAACYPVIYLLDGSADEDYPHIAGLVQFLSFPWISILPESIVVGIANVDRKRDFTHTTADSISLKYIPNGGSSAKFITFLEKELQPYIDSNYNTTNQKTIIGQSLGGLLATEILITKPNLFTHYIIVSPSLWWDRSSLLSHVPVFLKAHPDLSKYICVAVGREEKQMNDDVSTLISYFKKYAPMSLKWKYIYLPKENHATLLHRSVYRAFELFYPVKEEQEK